MSFDSEREFVHATDVSEDSPVVTVVRAVAVVSDRDPTEMEPLHRVVDTEALNALCAPDRPDGSEVAVTFDYCGYRVRVTGSGDVSLASRR